ncbi:MAG: SDR family NAD(P)-dependent oxidoreductase [Flavobacteriales bacterium]|nr:SDR family NAD(P)-dependent oxidoreductase [Flavobacteriales bacterium]
MARGGYVQVVLVTGGSSGLGKAICERLSALGHRVYGTGRNPGQDPSDTTWSPWTSATVQVWTKPWRRSYSAKAGSTSW